MRIRISTDSTADLSAVLIEKYNIAVSPLTVEMGGRDYLDGVDITPEDIYAFVGGGKGVCRTAAINVSTYEAHFAKLLETADAVIHFDISSEMSSCYQNACAAAEKCGRVYVVDSRNLSTGIGLLVLEAAVILVALEYTVLYLIGEVRGPYVLNIIKIVPAMCFFFGGMEATEALPRGADGALLFSGEIVGILQRTAGYGALLALILLCGAVCLCARAMRRRDY